VKNGNQSNDSTVCEPLPIISTINETPPAVTNVVSIVSSTSSSSILITTPTVQSSMSQTIGLQSSENTPKISEINKNNTSLKFSFGSPIASTVTSVEENYKQTNAVDEKVIDNKTSESINNTFAIKTQNSSIKNFNKQNKFISSPETNKNFQNEGQNSFNNDEDKSSFQFTIAASKPNEVTTTDKSTDNSKKEATPSFTFGAPKADKKQSTPVLQFGAPKDNEKQSTPVLQSEILKSDEKQTTPIMQFGKVVDKQSTPIMQFGAPKVDDKQSTPIMQFGAPKVDDKQSTPIMQFGAPKVDNKQTTPLVKFGVCKVDDKSSTPVLEFGATKTDVHQSTPKLQFEVTKGSENQTSTPLFSFGNNQKSTENSKSTDSVKFQFGPPKADSIPLTESTSVVFGSNPQNKNLFNFGSTNNITSPTGNPPKYDATAEKPTPKLQFGALPTSTFVVSTTDQSKPQFSTSVTQSTINQGPKLVFGSQTADNKPTASGMGFAGNTANPIFQFNNSGSKLGDKHSETPSSSFPFTTNTTTPAFGASKNPTFQFNAQKTEETKTPFPTSTFGSQSTSAPFKFGGNEKPASFGTTFPSTNQPLQFTNNTEKTTEPFKFGSTIQTSNAFQFSANKADNGSVKFGQASNTFSSSGFSGFGNSAPQQTTTFGTVQSSQPSPFGNITSPNAAPTFGSVASSPPNTFGTNQSFQFGSNAPSSSSTFAFGSNSQPTKPDGAFNFNAASTTTSPFQFGQAPSTPQFGGTQPNQGIYYFNFNIIFYVKIYFIHIYYYVLVKMVNL